MRVRPCPAICLLVLPAAAQAPDWEALELRGVRIGRIETVRRDVFDLEAPGEDTWIGRTANALHPVTRESVVRRVLLFKAGERVDARRIRASERALRACRFFKEARIIPLQAPDGTLVARVEVRDAWTLKASVGFSQVGGQRTWGFSLRDQNLGGFGKDLVFDHESGPDRSTETFKYGDRQFLGSRWTFRATYQIQSDGRARGLELLRPYEAVDTPWGAEAAWSSRTSTLLVRDREALVLAVPSIQEAALFGASRLVHLEGDRALRLGAQVERQDAHYGTPEVLVPAGSGRLDLAPRKLRGPALSLVWYQDRHAEFRNLAGMAFVEDYNLGWEGRLVVGHYGGTWGSLQEGPFLRASLAKGWAPDAQRLLLLRAATAGRSDGGRIQDAQGSTSLTAYAWGSSRHMGAARLALDAVSRPDPEHLLTLGGEDGLRGYPNFLHLGNRRWVLSLEDRILTSRDWLGILRLGFVLYADAGAIRRWDGSGWTRTYANVGGGLRFGDLKSSLGRVVLLTVAFPLVKEPGLDRYQVVVGNLVHF